MSIERLTFENFTVFENVDLRLVPGVNVFIGDNGTGKTHAMKAAYSVLQAAQARESMTSPILETELADVFRPRDGKVGRLARRRSGQGGNNNGRVTIGFQGGARCSFTVHSKGSPTMVRLERRPRTAPDGVFVPPHEMLAAFEGFIAAYEARELSFDKTYRDLAVALSANKLRSVDRSLRQPLEAIRSRSGEVILEAGQFFLKSGGARVEAALEAEGLRKVGTLVRLIETGAVRPDSILFWDEPEANLNPKLSAVVVDAVVALAGPAQVVIATHDYLVARRLSLISETSSDVPIRFFSFSRPSASRPATVTAASSLHELGSDILTDAFMDQMAFEYERHGG